MLSFIVIGFLLVVFVATYYKYVKMLVLLAYVALLKSLAFVLTYAFWPLAIWFIYVLESKK